MLVYISAHIIVKLTLKEVLSLLATRFKVSNSKKKRGSLGFINNLSYLLISARAHTRQSKRNLGMIGRFIDSQDNATEDSLQRCKKDLAALLSLLLQETRPTKL